MATREAEAGLRGGMRPLLFARSAAIVGASPRSRDAVANLVRAGIPAWGVNPGRAEVLGLPCSPSVADLPEVPEAALLLVGHRRVEEAFEDAAAAGVRAFVLPGLGNEAGAEGGAVAGRIAARAAELGASLLGPNCMGVAAPGGVSLWIGTVPDTFLSGRVAAVVQSGSVGDALLSLGPRVGFRCVVSTGGEAARDAADVLAFLAEDEGTATVALFLETVRRPPAFVRALERCAETGTEVVCLKVGRSRAGARAALAHTGAVAGSERAFSAVLRRHGAVEVDDFATLVETLELLGRSRRPSGARIAAISESGGESALLADHGEAAGIPFEPLPAALASRLTAAFPNFLDPQNPLDAWAIDEPELVYPGSLQLLACSGAFDLLVAQIDLSQFRGRSEQEWLTMIVRALADAAEGTDVVPAVVSVHTADPPQAIAELARARDLPLLRGMRSATRALAAAVRLAEASRPAPVPPSPATEPVPDLSEQLAAGGALAEHESALVLERYGLRFAPRRRAATAAEAARAAGELGFPLVVKVDGPAHKMARGGVALGVGSAKAAAEAARRLGGRVLLARQLEPGPEAFCGMTRDPDWGPLLAVGPGGAAVEALGLAAVALAPLDLPAARSLAAEAPGLAALAPPAALEDLARVLVALGRLAVEQPRIAAVDVNPLVLGPAGAIAVDALVVVEAGEPVLASAAARAGAGGSRKGDR